MNTFEHPEFQNISVKKQNCTRMYLESEFIYFFGIFVHTEIFYSMDILSACIFVGLLS